MAGNSNSFREADLDTVLYPLIAVTLVIAVLWYFYGGLFFSWMNTFLMEVVWGEYRFLSALGFKSDDLLALIYQMQRVDTDKFPLQRFDLLVSHHFWLLVIPLAITAVMVILVNRARGMFFRVFDYYSLKREMTRIYPQSWSVLHLNPWDDERKRGAFTRSETAWEWCVRHGVIDRDKLTPLDTRNTWRPDVAREVLKRQIGDVFPTSIDGVLRLPWSTKTILAIMLSVLEDRKDIYRYLIESSATPDWFRIYRDGGRFVYSFRVPDGDKALIDDVIRKALMDSVQILPEARRAIDLSSDGDDIFYTNRVFLKAFLRHHLIQTVLMDIKRNIPMFSINECLWLKAVNSNLFYALDAAGAADSVEFSYNPGNGKWLIRALAPATAYWDERRKEVELRESLKKRLTLSGPNLVTRDLMMQEYSWDLMVSAVYQELENTNWVHHSRYQDISEEDEIGKLGGIFNYENQCYCIFSYMVHDKDNFTAKSVQFFDDFGQQITPAMSISSDGKMESIVDARRFLLISESRYIKTPDVRMFRNLVNACAKKADFENLRAISYDIMSDVREVTGKKYFSWPRYVADDLESKSGKRKSVDFSINLGDLEFNKTLVMGISDEIKQLYMEGK